MCRSLSPRTFARWMSMKSLQMELPFWVRAVLLAGVFCIVAGAGLIAYRLYQHPVTLTVAVGSLDGAARQTASLIAAPAPMDERVRAVLRVIRLPDIIPTFEDEAQALASFRPQGFSARR